MDAIMELIGSIDTKVIVIALVIAVILLLLAIVRKIRKLVFWILIIGFLIGLGKPLVMKALASHGVQLEHGLLTIEGTEGQTQVDLSLVKHIQILEGETETEVIIRNEESILADFRVSNGTMRFVNIALGIAGKIGAFGYEKGSGLDIERITQLA